MGSCIPTLEERLMDTNASKMKVAYVVTERGDKSYWNRIGVAFTNRDGSLNVKLDAFPANGALHIRDFEPRDEVDGSSGRGRRVAPRAGAQPLAGEML